ncbi:MULTISPECIES: hypothetical protein [Methylosinus]|uniref:FecR protein domain-containing protein n=1 Tax=Methylosinus trichosporium (strain ATCC 35070 / NCIMB 11131 / UNIQEM 75 / OB3b) TaxID=595536 RepID=A0A2D2CW24_METT3|nr:MULTISPECIES: hypothetical protein [Methylosinus]ATQ66920.1 hypothetical protein CQW49_02700 [Methylosinus trichosporium OB3b]OBS54118.1 hypothetical protein A8B73_02445 [Methylosinus sp. 3S-1]
MRFVIFVMAFSVAAATAAGAAPESRAICADADSARLSMPKGVALMSRGGSFSEIHDGAQILAGDRLLIRSGSASLFGSAALLVRADAGSLLTLERRDGRLCVARVSSHPEAAAASSGAECDKDESERDPAKCPPISSGGAPGGGLLAGAAIPVVGVAAGAVAGGVAAGTSSASTDKNSLPKISPQ